MHYNGSKTSRVNKIPRVIYADIPFIHNRNVQTHVFIANIIVIIIFGLPSLLADKKGRGRRGTVGSLPYHLDAPESLSATG